MRLEREAGDRSFRASLAALETPDLILKPLEGLGHERSQVYLQKRPHLAQCGG